MVFAKALLLLAVGIATILMGLIVVAKDYRKLQNKLFFLLALSLGGWVIGIGGFLLSSNASVAFAWAKAYYSFPLGIAAAVPLFSYSFPYNDRIPRKIWLPVVLGYLAVAVPLLAFHSFLTTSLAYHSWGKEIILNYLDYSLYSIYLLGAFALGLIHTYIKSLRATGLARAQNRFYFYGFLTASSFGVFFNLILPWFGNYRLIWLGPLFASAFVLAFAYSIIRHRTFDVRLVVARTLTYALSLLVFAAVYGFVIFGIAQYVFGVHFPVLTQIFISLATGLAALSFHRLKTAFDKATTRLFYRDAYDSQDFFDEVNQALVSSLDLDKLLSATSQTIAKFTKTGFCVIGVKDDVDSGHLGQHVVGTQSKSFPQNEINQVRKLTPHLREPVLVVEDLGAEHEKLRHLLAKHDIALLARITSNASSAEEGLGYIVLGNKKSGGAYTSQDRKVLATIANELVIAIQNALRFEETEKFNATLQERVETATRKLEHTNARLKQLNNTKDDFIGMASHQLRTPLTSVKGYISLVLDEDAGKITGQQRKLLTQAFISSQRMVALIADLLNVSRLRTGKFVIEPGPVNLADMAAQEIKQLKETAEARGITLEYHKPAHFPVVTLDETKTRQVIMNFLDNAIYYTELGGHITLQLHETPKTIELKVVDNGIGVPKSEQHHLFTKFYRAPNAQKARPDGTGIGLFMAKKVITGHGGSVIFDSKEGEGSTFGFSFPKDKVLAPPSEPAEPKLVASVR
jgi:signal transduction histidine kinase